MECISFQVSEKEEEFNINSKNNIYVVSLGELQIYKLIQAPVIQAFGFSLYLFWGKYFS